jgi:serine phosphatase RsbU (regulator of sigma subunit)
VEAWVRLAGHPPPLVLGPRPQVVAPPVGLPLGISATASWTPAQVVLDPGWALLVHTDGLIEGRGSGPDELLWTEGLIDVLTTERDTDLDRLPARLVERAQQLNGGALMDDVAILLLSSDAAPSDMPPSEMPPSEPVPATAAPSRTAPAGLAVTAGELP